jgi:osmotically-inducible protein OsmY
MHVTTGPARYFFLRQPTGVKEEVPNWPPDIKPLQEPDNVVCVAIFLSAEEHGWRAEAVRDEEAMRADAGGAFVLTRETALGLSPDGRRSTAALELLGARVALLGEKGPEYATHLVVRAADAGLGMPKQPLVVPITALFLEGYLEHGDQAEAQLGLRFTPGELANMPPYMQDPTLERVVNRALDHAILSERQRHEIKPEVIAGRVTLYGRAELTTIGEVARDELERTPGVIEVVDRIVYGELLMEEVKEQLAAKGFGDLDVRFEHGLIELHGTVPDNASIHRARDLAQGVTGVRGVVVNQLTVLPLAGSAAESAPMSSAIERADGAKAAEAPAGAPPTGAAAQSIDSSQAKVSGSKRS